MRARWGRRGPTALALAGALVAAAIVAQAPAGAGTPPPNAPIVVTTTQDVTDAGDGLLSLREAFAVSEAQDGHDEIVLVPDETHLTACAPHEEVLLSQDEDGLTLTGGHATIDTTCTGRLLEVNGADSHIEDVTLTGATDEEVLWVDDAVVQGVTIRDVVDDDEPTALVVANGGGISGLHLEGNDVGTGALVSIWGPLIAAAVTATDNVADIGIVSEVGTTIRVAHLVDNDFGFAAIAVPGPSRIEESAIAGNAGAGVIGLDGPPDPAGDVLSLRNTTITENFPDDGEAGGIRSEVPIGLNHVTVLGNAGVDAARDQLEVSAPSLASYASIIAERNDASPRCAVTTSSSSGWNLADDDCGLDGTTDLSPVGSWHVWGSELESPPGRVTTTVVRPRPGSPAIDALPAGPCSFVQSDQRGVRRPQGEACDIGAYEVEVEFRDVTGNHPFSREITWLQQQNIANGYPDYTFRPGVAVSRGATAVFLHRLSDDPVHDPPDPPTFSDVGRWHPFGEEIEWLVDRGVAEGYADGTFRPAAPVSRGAMAAFLHRFAGGEPFDLDIEPTFADVGETHPFYEDVEWVRYHGIARGHPDGTYRPTSAVSRGAMAAFLYRLEHTPSLD